MYLLSCGCWLVLPSHVLLPGICSEDSYLNKEDLQMTELCNKAGETPNYFHSYTRGSKGQSLQLNFPSVEVVLLRFVTKPAQAQQVTRFKDMKKVSNINNIV